jgi:dTDP-4-dehydrorhamnose 3,5-epimerase-like enzyme
MAGIDTFVGCEAARGGGDGNGPPADRCEPLDGCKYSGAAVAIDECKLLELPTVEDPQGNLAFAEGGRHIPFSIARAYHVYAVPAGARRGGHAHRRIEQVVVCLHGGFEVVVDDGRQHRAFALSDPRQALYLPPLIWHDLAGFEAGSAYYVVSSGAYEEAEYIRDRDEFQLLVTAPVAATRPAAPGR